MPRQLYQKISRFYQCGLLQEHSRYDLTDVVETVLKGQTAMLSIKLERRHWLTLLLHMSGRKVKPQALKEANAALLSQLAIASLTDE